MGGAAGAKRRGWGGSEAARDARATLAGEPRSKVTFDIEPAGPMVKLTVIHDAIEPGGTLLQGVSQGWPAILASLKTLLETGRPLPSPEPAAAK
jgi:hypothetical protein